jgi:arginase
MEQRRISLIGVPLCLGAGIVGAGAGYHAVRTARLTDALKDLGLDVCDSGSLAMPATPSDVGDPKARYLEPIVETCDRLAAWIEDQLAKGSFPLVIGGDHSIGAGTVAGTAAHWHRSGKSIGMIWLDAHGDMNTPETTPSGNVHGMPVAASLGLGPKRLADIRGFSPKVKPEHTVLIGVRDLDPKEFELIEQEGVRCITTREIDERGMFHCMHEAIERALDGTCGLHVSLDMDALDPSVAPGVGTPVPGGLTFREAHLALEMIADTDRLLSFDVVEVNPMLDAHNLTAKIAVGLIASVLGKSIIPRTSRRARPLAHS